ncbi:MAG: dTMP kinase [Candidatus Altiarchaeum hamiconexum]|uniref:Probable thymidylate kinase n=1 Tax=Candidatus Altarchaeum hamiconexum TaxID=1803513 RepID=A0A8J7YT22_9ARCH|nr:dTMP kinase [Candidatus Altarchaeum hamiconexum]OIQ05824.1 MAG: dTMP kinase [Candidatus Altarchaeum sp. CG2_30_32_3053]PIN67202.1 MAG: dTMP kinase [Candidatus Altarchaeum sp. CG12_big_fil_rev_8_21_14_0_65_33_22]PIV28135.1 MAG: dTMP kinase [Candidatus Altarchaeum sp. CG03_land_8_20_14_0_80_32_618]PIX48597.1 MAG: dTMP kinase [Candidatus Altarchaeum sp. CG_4_8_14_3_um_filter_33_2054]PIZ31047.1 MAG: dTMP kinase [Candidatus Altarchaeum sp. CG_4_10_14_0_8_um_filter_32_851]
MKFAKDNFQRNGALIIVEGVDGSGKSTQVQLIGRWLESQGFSTVFTEWKSALQLKPMFKKIWKEDIRINPYVFSYALAADFYQRMEKIVIPALKIGQIVISDRWAFTGIIRDTSRGLDRETVENIYQYAIKPDVALYYDVPPEVAVKRKTNVPRYYESGSDLGLPYDRQKNFEVFEGKQIETYRKLAGEGLITLVDGNAPITLVSPKSRNIVKNLFKKRFGVII